MMNGMAGKEWQKTRATVEAGINDRRFFKKYFSFFVAILPISAFAIAFSLGVLGCSSFLGAGLFSPASRAPFSSTRQSPLEVSRLLSNAHYYTLMGRPELAIKELEQAHQQNPDNLKIVNILAQKYEEVGQLDTARKLYQEALTRSGAHPALANNLCFTYYLEGHWQKAEKCYLQALAQDPGNEAARNNLGLLYCRLGRQDEARNLWQQAEGPAVAAYKTRHVLAVLGKSDQPVYSQASAPAPTQIAVNSLQVVTDDSHIHKVSLAPQKIAMTLTPQTMAEKQIPNEIKPLDEIQPQSAPTEVSSTPALRPGLLTPSDSLTAGELAGTAIEIRNGNGYTNMARQTRALLNLEGFRVAKIGNHRDFGVETTIIYFRPESGKIAQAISHTLFPEANLQSSSKLPKNIAVKILLGADLLDRPQLMARLTAK